MKRKKAALYDPYLDTLGGGERHILSILKVLEDHGMDVTLFWDKDISDDITTTLNFQFTNLQFAPRFIKKSRTQRAQTLAQYDIFLYVTDGSYFFSSAKKNYIFSMVPNKALYRMNWLNKIKLLNYSFITNSFFTQKRLAEWGINAEIIYPYIENHLLNLDSTSLKKESIILSVGRFFPHLHSKRQDVLIKFFLKAQAQHPQFSSYKLVFAGGLMPSDQDYFNSLIQLAEGSKSIVFYPNIDSNKLKTLYKKSQFYWHAAGYGVDQLKHPELVEHLGITPLEAMSAGCISFCYKAGGPIELIKDGVNGFLFKNFDDLIKKMLIVMPDKNLQTAIKSNAKTFLKLNFSYDVFKHRVNEVFVLA